MREAFFFGKKYSVCYGCLQFALLCHLYLQSVFSFPLIPLGLSSTELDLRRGHLIGRAISVQQHVAQLRALEGTYNSKKKILCYVSVHMSYS